MWPLIPTRFLDRKYQIARYGKALGQTLYDYAVMLSVVLAGFWFVFSGMDWTNIALALSLGAVLAVPTALAPRLDPVIEVPQPEIAVRSRNWTGHAVVIASLFFLVWYVARLTNRYLPDYEKGIDLGVVLSLCVDRVVIRTRRRLAGLERDAGGPTAARQRHSLP
jgi:hypothetical protein